MTGPISEIAIAGARTVRTVHEQFDRLKQVALVMSEAARSSERGYFTPTEDEETRHLMVSYWQSRNALLEVVFEMRELQQRPDAFLVGYTGALVLVDAARFLYDQFDDRPVIREKLNEPAPHFGIPGDVYDQVQASLANPVHAWHLYHAAKYFDDQAGELRRLAEGTELEPLLVLVAGLQQTARLSLAEYTMLGARVQARRLLDTIREDLLERALYGVQKSVSSAVADIYTLPGHQPGMPAEVVGELKELLQPGDVLIVRKEHALTNYFLPGFWPHAALYLGSCDDLVRLGIDGHEHVVPHWDLLADCGSDEPWRVNEAMKDGVRIRTLGSPFKSDAITVLRPQLEKPLVAAALTRALFHTGKPYDFDFDFTRSDRLVCTEVVYRAYEGVGDMKFSLTRRAGRLTLSAEDLVAMALAGKHFEPVATYAPPAFPDLRTGADAAEVLRATSESAG